MFTHSKTLALPPHEWELRIPQVPQIRSCTISPPCLNFQTFRTKKVLTAACLLACPWQIGDIAQIRAFALESFRAPQAPTQSPLGLTVAESMPVCIPNQLRQLRLRPRKLNYYTQSSVTRSQLTLEKCPNLPFCPSLPRRIYFLPTQGVQA